jgi:hypothetical protein
MSQIDPQTTDSAANNKTSIQPRLTIVVALVEAATETAIAAATAAQAAVRAIAMLTFTTA